MKKHFSRIYIIAILSILVGGLFPSGVFAQQPGPVYQPTIPPIASGVFKVTFPPNDQVITETSAQIKGLVTTVLTSPVNITAVSGISGQPLGNEKTVLTVPAPGIVPGEQKTITLTFSGLTPGVTYAFALRNNGITSSPVSFTTPNNSSVPNPLFNGSSLGTSNNPNTNQPAVDTISEKGIVPKCGRTPGDGVPDKETEMCTYKDFLQLIENIVTYTVTIISIVVGIYAIYSGVMIIWLGKDGDPTAAISAEIKKHKQQLLRIAVGVAIMASSYLIVLTIVRELGVREEYTLLDVIN